MRSRVLMIFSFIVSLFLFSGFSCLAASSDGEQIYKFRLQHWQPTSSATYKLFVGPNGFPANVERASKGRIKIETYPCGAIVPPTETVRAVGRGVLEMGAGCPAYQAKLGSYFSLLYGIPFTLQSMEDVEIVWRNMGLGEYARELYARHNVFLVGWHHESPICLFSKKPIRKIDDLKGLKVRAVGTYGELYTMAGAAALGTPGAEIYTALERGVADACTWGSEAAMVEIGLHEVTDYITTPWVSGGTAGDLYINMDIWKKLPDDLKQVMKSCMEEWANVIGSHYRYASLKARQDAVEKYKMTVTQLEPESLIKLRKLAVELMKKHAAKSKEGARIVQIHEEFLKLKGM